MIMSLNPCVLWQQAKAAADSVFMPGNELSSIKVAVKRLQQGALSDGRSSSKCMSVVGKLKAEPAKGKQPFCQIRWRSCMLDAASDVKVENF